MNQIRVVIADDHQVVRDGMVAVLQTAPFIQIVGIATSFADVLTLLPTHPTDVIVLDVQQMGGSALMFVTRLARDYPDLKIIIFSSSKDMAPELLGAGAHGYVVKDDVSRLLIPAIQTVMANGQFLSPAAQTYVELAHARGRDIPLTTRELSILKLMCLGHGTSDLSAELGIEIRTVQNYIGKLMAKIGCDERIQLVNWYRRIYGEG